MSEENIPLNPDTFYAPAGRSDDESIQHSHRALAADVQLSMITEAMPDVALILDSNRQVVYANHALVNMISVNDEHDVIGLRAGEIFHCVNLAASASGCGTSKACRMCGAVNAILDCQQSGKAVTRECRITTTGGEDGQQHSLDLEVKASPFRYNNEQYIMLGIKDISDKKRRLMLERMFFHDILNTAAGLNGLLMALENPQDEEEYKSAIIWAKKAGNELVEELLSQRALMSAESGDLELNITRCSPVQLLNDVATYLSYHQIALDKRIFIDPFSHSAWFESDPQLIKRVLINLMKNALEASPAGSVIKTGAKLIDKYIRFWVNNPGEIPEEVKLQIFQRSFSTKGANRGIGTYSIKILTTKYLKGTDYFESEQESGTTFWIEIPVSLSKH